MASNSKAKGDRAENRIASILEKMGCISHVTIPAPKRRRPGGGWYSTGSNDIFGLFDVVAKAKDERTIWVQVTYMSGLQERRKKLREAMDNFTSKHDCVFIAAWVPPKHGAHRGFFNLYRMEDDFLKGEGWTLKTGDQALPWDARQVKL